MTPMSQGPAWVDQLRMDGESYRAEDELADEKRLSIYFSGQLTQSEGPDIVKGLLVRGRSRGKGGKKGRKRTAEVADH